MKTPGGKGIIDLQFPELPDFSPDPILITTADVKIYYVNPAWEQFTGYKFSEVKGENPRFLQSGKTPKAMYQRMWQTLLKGESFRTDEIIDKRKDGSLYQTYSLLFPIKRAGKIVFFVQMQHDVTAQKALDLQKDTFANMASHELKTPITTIKGYIDILTKQLAKAKQINYLPYLSKMDFQINRLIALVDELLDVSKIQTNKLDFQKEEIEIDKFIKEIVGDMQQTTERHRLIFEGNIKNKIIDADKYRLYQVMANLILNAIKYSPKSDQIIIKTKLDKDQAVVSIQDFGIGISERDQAKVFDRFFQGRTHIRQSAFGLGLGLYIAKEILNHLKGEIWLESIKGQGSTFFFKLPIKK